MKDKVILVDADGVLLDWEYMFTRWMNIQGHTVIPRFENSYKIGERYGLKNGAEMIREFNHSAWIGFIPSLRDSVKYVRKLHDEHGYLFHVITSLSTDEYAGRLRKQNLEKLFGETVFERFVFLDTGADKDEALEEYKNTGCWWFEDKFENAVVGQNLGLRSILIDHHHNKDLHHAEIPRVVNWAEAYELITQQ